MGLERQLLGEQEQPKFSPLFFAACWKPAFICRAGMVTGALVLTTSVSLNILLLALGLVHCKCSAVL